MVLRTALVSALFATVAAQGTLDDYKQGKQDEKDDAAAKAAKEAKMAAVNKVITMLEDLSAQVLAEGEKEAAAYNKFACFCKDTTQEKSDAITKGEDDKSDLTARIESLSEKRDDLDEKIEQLTDDIATAEKELAEATAERHETFGVYSKNSADLEGALTAIAGAIDVLKSSKKPALVQLQSVAKTVQTATLLADALGIKSASQVQQGFVALLQQNPEVEMEDYKFKSGSVIETLEGLRKDFRETKNEVDSDEVKSVAEFDALKQEKLDYIKAKNVELDEARSSKEKTTSSISMATEELTTTSADLLDDKQYLKELAELCEARAKTWDARSKVRADELSALTSATTIIKSGVADNTSANAVRFAQQGVRVNMAHQNAQNPAVMEAFEAEAEATEASPSFLQKRMVKAKSVLSALSRHSSADPDAAKNAVMELLRSQGTKLHSTLLIGLANQIKADPFAKVKKLIQDLIERLLQEAADEASQKGWCDKAMSDAEQKRTYAVEKVAELNAQSAELEATIGKLNEELEVLDVEIPELEQKQEDATSMRKEEHSENQATVMEAEAGLEAVNEAIDILDKFYKTAAKSKVDLGLVQGPLDDAPDSGFDNGEAYTGAGGESGGILGMLDVIKSDFERTISTTNKAEDQNEKEYQKFMTESGKSLAEKKMAHELKTGQKDDAITELESADEDLRAQTDILKVAIRELLELKPTCIDTGMTYEERVARREDEIESLKKALCTLEHSEDFGPEGGGAEC
jgi:hypothetical protein